MTSRSADLMNAVCAVAGQYQVPVLGMADTTYETVAPRRGVPLVAELYVESCSAT